MAKVLIVETNVQEYGKTGEPTGLWLGESAEFVADLQKAGIDYDFVSPKGGFVPLDPRSMKYTNQEIMDVYEQPDFIKRGLQDTMKPEDVDPKNYDAIYYTGGHGVMWDFPDNSKMQDISREIYENGGYISAVCHGIAGLMNIKGSDGQYLIKDKKVTGFTTAEEVLAGKKNVVPFLNKDVATERGADFIKKRFYSEFAIADGRMITGQNPFSVHAVSKLLIPKLKK